MAVAAGVGIHPPGPPPEPPAVGRPADPPGVEKNLRRRVRRLRRANPGKAVEVWAEDEARLGLKPIARRVWALKGHRPRSNGQSKFESLYVFGFTHPATGRTRALIQPKARAL